LESNWSPKRDAGQWSCLAPAPPPFFRSLNPLGLSPPKKTRQTRQFVPNYLIAHGNSLSGRVRNPTTNPTNCHPKPDKSLFAHRGSHNTHNTQNTRSGLRNADSPSSPNGLLHPEKKKSKTPK
jgi:hypothetical protein